MTDLLKNEHQIRYSASLKKRLNKANLPLKNSSDQYSGVRFFKIDKAQRHPYWTFDVGRSMFDVQGLSSAWRIHCSGQAEFHTRGSQVRSVQNNPER